jgi:cysteine desulfurase/selenocysteine lyase
VDGAQSVPHLPVNVQEIGCDFLAFSGHKMLGPTGSGILWGRREILEEMPPFLCGGDMIKEVTFTATRWNDLPWKFEAGTPAIAEAIGLGVAVDYLTAIGMENIHAMEQELTTYAMECLGALRGVTIYGPPAPERGGVVAFSVKGVHPHDLASLLDEDGVAIRAGHHCAMPLHSKLGISASARASMYLYNLREDIDRLVQSIERAQRIFGV